MKYVSEVFLDNLKKKRAHDCVVQRNFLIKTLMSQPVICIRVTRNIGT